MIVVENRGVRRRKRPATGPAGGRGCWAEPEPKEAQLDDRMKGTDEDINARIRERAYRLWIEEGRPDGRSQAHWDMAVEMVRLEDQMAPRPALKGGRRTGTTRAKTTGGAESEDSGSRKRTPRAAATAGALARTPAVGLSKSGARSSDPSGRGGKRG